MSVFEQVKKDVLAIPTDDFLLIGQVLKVLEKHKARIDNAATKTMDQQVNKMFYPDEKDIPGYLKEQIA